MRTRQLGRSDLHLTTVGFGAWAIGGQGYKFSWGPQDDNDSIAAIREAVAHGVNWIDTAAVYGAGHSETVVGRALQGFSPKPFVATKCGRVLNEERGPKGDLRPEHVRQECEESLRRLKVERIDLYQIHWPDPDPEIEGAWEILAKLKEQGKVRHLGVSNFSPAQMRRLQKLHPIASLQPPYSMLRREIEADILPFCAEHGIGVVCYSPMQCGLLTGAFDRARLEALAPDDWRRRNPFFQDPSFGATLELVEGMRRLAARLELTCAQLALAWVLRRPEITSAIAGARKPGQIAETAKAGDVDLPADVIAKLDALLANREKKVNP
ncbi:MAG: aldo/keto reductase [Planctomycetota bacterium]|nr:aldo/keto reductase [Planctomycetota bacterium]